MKRPNGIKHYTEILDDDNAHYPGSREHHGITSPFARRLGLKRLGINHELLPPGRRTSWPHAHLDEEEFVYVIEGNPHVWIDGQVFRLGPGDGVAFPPGTGSAHTFINNTESDVRLLVVGEANRTGDKTHYPLHDKRNKEIGERHWDDVPARALGPHDGLPDALR